MKTTTIDELLDRDIGKKGTPGREKFDAKVQAGIIAGQLKELRKQKNLTQQQLADLVGMDKGGISKIEKGTRNLTIETINRIAHALGAKVNLSIQV
jgi:HTH-type transcriptional regulator / antitoxin HipB